MITRRKLIGLGIVLSLFYTILVTAQTGSFRQPPAKFKFHALDHDLVSRENPEPYIDSLIERGVTGLVINVTWYENYMKDEKAWQSLNQLVRLLKSKGLLLWIYDEYGYPSGHAGGLVLAENKDYEALGIVVVKEKSIKNIKNWKKPDDVLEVIYDYHHQNQHYIVCAVRLYEGTAAAANFKRPYINIADKEAVDAFIRITHDAYFQNMENLSRDIDAFFTDEPGLMEGYIDADREYKGGHKYAPVAWAKGLEKEFKKQHGYDLMPKIHSLFEGDDTDARLVRIHYRQTLASLVSDAYFQNITDWCAKHGVKSSGHINNEEYIHEHVAYYGNLFTTLDKNDWIGFDILRGTISRYMSETGEARFMGPKFAGSLARIRGKSTTVMVELCPLEYYLNALHEVTDDQLRAVCNMMWMSGANYLNSYWNINSISDPNGFSNYLGRMGYMLEGTVHDSRIGVYYPVETIQALYKPLHTVQMDNRKLNSEIGRTEKAFQNLTIELWNNQCDYDFLDAQAIENAEVIDGTLRIAGMEFKVVIMSYVQVLPLSVLNKLKTFEQSGGKVVWTGSFPQHGVNSGETAKIAACAKQIRLSENPASDAAAAADDPMRWESQSPFIVSRFSKDGKPIYMLINNTDKPIEIQGKSLYLDNFELFNPRTGDITQLNKCEFVIDRFSAVFLTGMLMAACQSERVTVNSLRCELLTNPRGLDSPSPHLSWEIAGGARGVKQTAYQILVASSLEKLQAGEGDLWDSGAVQSDASVFIPYAGKPLESRTACYWKVQATTDQGVSMWSDPAVWSMGLLKAADWHAQWTGLDKSFAGDVLKGKTHLAARYFRKEFETAQKPVKATLYLSGLGLYKLYVNGRKIGDQEPFIKHYESMKKWLSYMRGKYMINCLTNLNVWAL